MIENDSNVFSKWFENLLLKMLEKYFDRFMEMAEQRSVKSGFIKRESACKYYDGISVNTLLKYEDKGLKRIEPIEGGTVYYSIAELDRFMLLYEK